MRPVMQTTYGTDRSKPEELGDCFLACLASLLEVDIHYFPREFLQLDSETCDRRYKEWLLEHFDLYQVDLTTDDPGRVLHGYHIINGRSPRAKYPNLFDHCVVGFCGKMVHDPHPSGKGVLDKGCGLTYTVLVPRTPAKRGE
jgi:hypothetical protein